MTAVYLQYRPGDKVMIKGADVEATVMRVSVGPHDAIVYEVQYWIDGEPLQYQAFDMEIDLIEAYVER